MPGMDRHDADPMEPERQTRSASHMPVHGSGVRRVGPVDNRWTVLSPQFGQESVRRGERDFDVTPSSMIPLTIHYESRTS